MKVVVVFTATGPILVITSYPSIDDPNFIRKLKEKGIEKFVSFEVDIERCRNVYGSKCYSVIEDLQSAHKDDMMVLDIDGVHILKNFSLKKIGPPFVFEE
jgi:hypothetical protein